MKARLTFDLDKEEDAHAFRYHAKADYMHSFLFHLRLNFAKEMEWKFSDKSEAEIAAKDIVIEEINKLAAEHGIDDLFF